MNYRLSGGVSPDKPPGAAHSYPGDRGAPEYWAVGHTITQPGKGQITLFLVLLFT